MLNQATKIKMKVAKTEKSTIACQNCGNVNVQGANFCNNCGVDLR